MNIFTKIVFLQFFLIVLCKQENDVIDLNELDCNGNVVFHNVTLSAYFTSFTTENSEDYLDDHGKKLGTLQDFLDDRAPYVTVSMDPLLKIPYGKAACIPELNRHFLKNIKLQIRDSCPDLIGTKYRRAEICVRSEADSYDDIVNLKKVTLFLSNV